MPVQCSSSALTGASGLVQFKPAGVTACLEAADFPAGTTVTVLGTHDFQVGDPVTLTYPAGGTADGTLAAGDYFIQATAATTISLSSTKGGAAINLDGAAATADDWGAEHAEIKFKDYEAVCSVTEWSLNLTKDQTDTTTLPCSVSGGAAKAAPVRTNTGTFLNGEGSMSLLFTADQASFGRRLIANSVFKDSRVDAKLYVDAVSGGATINDAVSAYFEGPVNLLGFELSVNTTDAIVATVSFSLADTPTHLLGVDF